MNLINAFVHRSGVKDDGALKANATVMVDGLGEIKIDAALSGELCRRIEEEAIAALRVRLGQTLKESIV